MPTAVDANRSKDDGSGTAVMLICKKSAFAPLPQVYVKALPSDLGQSVCRDAYAITGDFGPTDDSFCLGSGTSTGRTNWLGSPFEADGVFYAQSRVRMTDIKDGTSDTVGVSERILGKGDESITLAS